MIRSGVVAAIVLALAGPAAADCKTEVDDAFAKLRGSKGFRLETKIVNEQQGSLTMTVDYQLPDRMHQRVSLGNAPARMETIAIGSKVWSNQGQGWNEVPANFAEAISKQLQDSVAQPSKSTLDYVCLGEKNFEGKDYLAYTAKLPAVVEEKAKGEKEKPAEPDNVQTLYVDKATGLPARNIVTKGDTETRLFDGTFSTPGDLSIKEPS